VVLAYLELAVSQAWDYLEQVVIQASESLALAEILAYLALA
jgi:hypothetical protein